MFSLDLRPKSFSEMIGQKKILEEMKNNSMNNSFPQVMLFSGPWGSGKNTLANIISKLLNCSNPIKNRKGYLEPCNNCKFCKNIDEERFTLDTKLIDCTDYKSADVENLKKDALLGPMFGSQNKIFILDEFQALGNISTKGKTLKLLEKKRKNVYFILLTSVIDAIPGDIIQRCQRYNFKPVNPEEIYEYLFNLILDMGDIPEEFIKEGLMTIAQNSDGSVRLAVQYLNRCIAGKLYSKEDIENELNIVNEERELEIIFDLLNKKSNGLWSLYNLKDIKTFFFRSKKILYDANIYKLTKMVDYDWKKKTAIPISNISNLSSLIGCYNNVYTNFSFNVDQFIYNIVEYYQLSKIKVRGQ